MTVALFLAGIAMSPAAQGGPETFDFTWRPRPRQITRYALSMHVDLPGTKLTLTGEVTQTVGKKDKSGAFSVSTKTRNMRAISDADSQTLADEPPTVERYDARGRPLDSTDDSSGWFAGNLAGGTNFVPPPRPVSVGQSWTTTTRASGGRFAGRLSYRLTDVVVRAKIRLLHIRFTYAEAAARQPVHGEGYFYVDSRDFSIVEGQAVVHNVRISPDLPPSPNVEVRLKRI